jgi:putative membrane protein
LKKFFLAVIVAVAFFVGVTFTIKNSQVVELSYYFGIHWNGPLSWLVIVVFIFGVLTGILVYLTASLKKKIFSDASSSKKRES